MFTSDWHLHSRNSCDCRKAPVKTTMAETVAAIQARGILDFGVTDHIFTPLNLPDLEASRREFEALPPSPHIHFGVEVGCVSVWELQQIAAGGHADAEYGLRTGGPVNAELAIGMVQEDLARLGVEYVVGGVHWPLYAPYERAAIIRDYHRQNMFLASHPLVDIVAHPWWWTGHWKEEDGSYRTDPWFDDFRRIPVSMHNEFAAAAREHGTVVEVNFGGILLTPKFPTAFKHQYVEYLAGLKADGVSLSIGSDHHAQYDGYGDGTICGEGLPREVVFGKAVALLAGVGILDADMWRLPPCEREGITS